MGLMLYRMIFWELVKVFLLTLTALTGLFMIGLVIQQANQMGLSAGQTLQVIPLLIPVTFPYTIPATTLFASCVVYGRLSNDNEVVAMKAAGVDPLTLLRPALALGVVMALATAVLEYAVIPRCWQEIQAQLLEDPEEILYNTLKREKRLRTPSVQYVVFVRDVQGRRLIDVVVKHKKPAHMESGRAAPVEYEFVARAREAKLLVDLEKGTLAIDAERWVWADNLSRLESKDNSPMEIPLPDTLTGKQVKAKSDALEWEEIEAKIANFAASRDRKAAEREETRGLKDRPGQTPAQRHELDLRELDLSNQIRDIDREIRNLQCESYKRPALALGCLCFAVIGCPVGIFANRSDYLSTFVVCFLPAVITYYPVLLAGVGLARDGKIPMLVGVWGADAILAVLAVVLTFRLIRR
jgi:lipopolysaccharide export system permease protein